MRRGDPIFLISNMAMHTQNIQADLRASLFVAQPATAIRLAPLEQRLLVMCFLYRKMKLAMPVTAICPAMRTAAPGWTLRILASIAFSLWTSTMLAVLA